MVLRSCLILIEVLFILAATSFIAYVADPQYDPPTTYQILQLCCILIEVVLIIGLESVLRWDHPRAQQDIGKSQTRNEISKTQNTEHTVRKIGKSATP